jgi:hypothetical protein
VRSMGSSNPGHLIQDERTILKYKGVHFLLISAVGYTMDSGRRRGPNDGVQRRGGGSLPQRRCERVPRDGRHREVVKWVRQPSKMTGAATVRRGKVSGGTVVSYLWC